MRFCLALKILNSSLCVFRLHCPHCHPWRCTLTNQWILFHAHRLKVCALRFARHPLCRSLSTGKLRARAGPCALSQLAGPPCCAPASSPRVAAALVGADRPLGPRPWAAHGRQRLRAPACPSRWSTCSGSPRMRARAACPCAAELLASHSARVLVCSSRRFSCDAWKKARGKKKKTQMRTKQP